MLVLYSTHAPESLYALIMTCLLISILLKGALLRCGQIFLFPGLLFYFATDLGTVTEIFISIQ